MLLGSFLAVYSAKLRLVQKEITEQKELFGGAMEASVLGMVIIRPDGRIITSNASFQQFLGFEDQELVDMHYQNLIFHADKRIGKKDLLLLIKGKIVNYQLEQRYRRKDKQVVWGKLAVSLVRDTWTGKVLHFIAQVEDIDNTRRLDEEKKWWAKRWRFALTINHLAMYEMTCHNQSLTFADWSFEMLGIAPNSVRKQYDWMGHIHPDDLSLYQQELEKMPHQNLLLEYRYRNDLGEYRWVRHSCQPIEFDAKGNTLRIIGTLVDITEKRSIQEENRLLAERVSLAAKSGGIGVWEYNIQSGSLSWDSRMFTLYGIPKKADIQYKTWIASIHPEDTAKTEQAIKLALEENRGFDTAFRIVTYENAIRYLHAAATVLYNYDNQPERMIGVCWDVSETTLLNQAIENTKERLAVTLRSIGEGVITLDSHLNVTFMNNVATEVTGFDAASAEGNNIDELITLKRDNADTSISRIISSIRHPEAPISPSGQITLETPHSRGIDIHLSIAALQDEKGELFGWVLAIRDTSDAKMLMEKLNYSANHDALTNLSNRHAFNRVLANHQEELALHFSDNVVALIALDRFKTVNDNVGHVAGDQMLKSVSLVLRSHIRKNDFIARIDGDQFALLLRGCPMKLAIRLVAELIGKIEGIHYQHNDQTLSISASAGLTLASDPHLSVSNLLNRADTALHAAKEIGKGIAVDYATLNKVSRTQGEIVNVF